ncbi:MAG: single-stranded-DNA-specific exonuclease RecJ [Lachnospiraceae bacterium]|jgi:single-stranded-DNA-specific exonuclease|nr:single-stranded-DNA-specific exonuclease RecJ [Lachnospiraceae bacterium]
MEKWVVTAKKADFKALGERFSIDPVVARVIRNRDVVGVEAMEEYLNGDISRMHDPGLMKDAGKTVELLMEKIGERKKIRIIGDYDIDGVLSTYILLEGLESAEAWVDVDIPDRVGDGYGLNERLIRKAYEDGVDTILTCDNGIAAAEEIALGKSLGMTVVVTDHHEVPFEEGEQGRCYKLPPADAVVNPKQADCPYPFKGLCGAGVAYKLVQLLFRRIGREEAAAERFLPYAAFATIGDVMDLVGENRILVKEGLKRLRETENLGLHALIRQNGLLAQDIKAYHVGFVLGPCLNASGRLDTALRALALLRAKKEPEAISLAEDLTDLNSGRKELTNQGVSAAQKQAEEAVREGDKVLVLFLPDCHESLAGIIAGRIREQFHRPVFVLTRGEEGVKGSGRSTEAYSMYEELCKIKDILTKFGGHPMAAGLSLAEADIPVMRQRLNEQTTLTEEDLIPKIRIDVPMPIDYITPKLVQELSLLEPFGKGNEKPVFADKELTLLSARVLGKNQNVLRMRIRSSYGAVMDAIYFGDIQEFKEYTADQFSKKAVDELFRGTETSGIVMSFVYYPEINSFHGTESLQIVVKNYC